MKGLTSWIIGILVVAVVLLCIYKYNKIVVYDEAVKETWTPLLGQLQQRYDQIPKLVNEIILYTNQEDEQTKSLAAADKKFNSAEGMIDKVKAANAVETALNNIFLQAGQRYPGIESHYQFMELNKGFQTTLQQMEAPMGAYNKMVDRYNTYVREFPGDFVALVLGFHGGYDYFKKEQD